MKPPADERVQPSSTDGSADAFLTPEPRLKLEAGARILAQSLEPHGFAFTLVATGKGSGGYFAEGEYRRDDRRLEFHFRRSLGLVRYHVGTDSASHASYMEALGVTDQIRYPGSSEDPLEGFRHLASDIHQFAQDFVTADASVLRQAAASERKAAKAEQRRKAAAAVGDVRARTTAREHFRRGEYADVVQLLTDLKYPQLMTPAERKMLRVAKERMGDS
jgi:hypothetical protein